MPRSGRKCAGGRTPDRIPHITALPQLLVRNRCGRDHLLGRFTRITVDPAQFGATRAAIRLALEREDIESRPLWKPMHLQPVFAGCEVVGGDVAAALFQHGLCLPSGTAMSEADLERIAAVIQSLRR
ncbi:MAG: DegT/DnrJ/EryC1/StrS family aminotransferase [Anaerolineae bacterium]|nr:DegT/DnrJ/EryC1/StrS family aminotransferase [Anaerolineae bacterium]